MLVFDVEVFNTKRHWTAGYSFFGEKGEFWMDKKLQVFISSTYEDMILERQGAVEAVLECGHIPAGMELFAADNKKQFEVIKKWIRNSDVFILILGGRYGSIEPESKKSYIQKEYEYAKHIGKKPIAILLSDNGIRSKIAKGDYKIDDKEYLSQEYILFKKSITNSKLCSYFDDVASLKNCIYNTLQNYEEDQNCIGWIKADSAQPEFSYPYILEYQEFVFKYIDLTTIEYTKRFKIKMLVDGLQYYTDRYSWNAGGTISKAVENVKQKIVDEFPEGAFTAYSIRLEEVSQKGRSYEIAVKFRIENSTYVEHQYLGLTQSFPAQVLKLRVEAPPNLKLSECKYNIFSHSVDRIPSKSQALVPVNNITEKVFKKLDYGERYNIEWTIK